MKCSNPIPLLPACALVLILTAGTGIQAQDVFTPGFVKREFYKSDTTGLTLVDDLRSDPKYPDSPDTTTYVPGVETPPNFDDDYGVRLSGLVTPPETGSYVFYISSDDTSEFWLSTDATPANLELLCVEPTWNNPREWNTPGSNATGRDLDNPENISPARTLTAGQQYYFEALMKEGGGGDNLAVTVAKAGDPVPANGTLALWGSWIGVNVPSAGASVQVTQQPANTSVEANQDTTLTAQATGTAPLGTNIVYSWRRNGIPILGGTSSNLVLTRVQSSDNNAKYSVLVALPGASAISQDATLTVTPDSIPPTLVSATADASFTAVTVTFSEPLDQASATAAGNYSLNNGATVSAAAVVNPTTVKLTTSKLTEDTPFTLTVSGVKDTDSGVAGNPIAANSTISFQSWVFIQGLALDRFWDNFTANTIAGLTNLATFPDSPDRVRVESAFEYPPDGAGEGGSNYGNLLEAWWTAPSSGDFIFFCSGDDPVNLYLSTDEDPANVKLIAQEPQWNNPRDWLGTLDVDALTRRPNTENRSDAFPDSQWPTPNTITLVGGNRYYLRALHTEGGGGDNVGVTYIKAGAAEPESGSPPIQGSEFGIYIDRSQSELNVTQQPAAVSGLEGRTTVVSVGATGKWQWSDEPFFQWQAAPSGGSSYSNIAGATSSSYTTPALAQADSGTQYRVVLSVPGLPGVTSQVASLTVQADTVPPGIAGVAASSSDALTVTFDEPLDPTTANTAGNYTLTGGLTVTTATLGGSSSNVVRLEVTGTVTAGTQYTLTVNGVKDVYNNTVSSLATTFTAKIVTYADIILQDQPIAFYRFEETTGQKTANLGTVGTSADGLYMAGLGADDSVQVDSRTEVGPRPPDFLGFSGSNLAGNFPGDADPIWIDTQKQLLQGLGAFTLEYWVRPSGGRLDDPSLWVTRVGIVGQNDAIEYGFIDQTTIQIWTPGGGSLNTTYSYPDDEWHHIATIATGQDLRNYFDGVLINTSGTPTANYGTSDFNVHIGGGGVFDATGNTFTGQIDEVAIFDKAIPADRIAAHFKAGKEGGVVEETQPEFTGITLSGGNISIEWTGGGTLQMAPSVSGPWTDVPGAASPYSAAVSGGTAFFRAKQ